MSVWISLCIRDKWKVMPQTLYLANRWQHWCTASGCVKKLCCCCMWNGSLHWALVGALKQYAVMEFWLPQESLQLKFIDECRLLMVLTVLTWALCITGPKNVKDGELRKSWYVWYTKKWWPVKPRELKFSNNFCHAMMLWCYDEEFPLWQPVKRGCITVTLKPIQSMEYHQKGSPAKKKKFKTPRLGQEKSWLQFFLWCRCGVIPMVLLKPGTTIKSEQYTA